MTVPRVYNTGTAVWDAIAVGEQGPQGELGPTGPTGNTGPPGAGVQLRGAYYGTSTPLPTSPLSGDMWVLGPPIPTAAPDRIDGPKEVNDGIVWDAGTATWINTGPLRGPRGSEGPPGPPGQATEYLLNGITGPSYTLVLSDAGRLVMLADPAETALHVPPVAGVAFPRGTVVNVCQLGAGQVTVTADSGVTIRATPGVKLRARYSQAQLVKIDTTSTNEWLLSGDISA